LNDCCSRPAASPFCRLVFRPRFNFFFLDPGRGRPLLCVFFPFHFRSHFSVLLLDGHDQCISAQTLLCFLTQIPGRLLFHARDSPCVCSRVHFSLGFFLVYEIIGRFLSRRLRDFVSTFQLPGTKPLSRGRASAGAFVFRGLLLLNCSPHKIPRCRRRSLSC